MSFENLDILCQAIKIALISGAYNYPLISLEVHIIDGKF